MNDLQISDSAGHQISSLWSSNTFYQKGGNEITLKTKSVFSALQSPGIWQQLESHHTSLLWCDHWDISMWTQLLLLSLGPAALYGRHRRRVQRLPLTSMHFKYLSLLLCRSLIARHLTAGRHKKYGDEGIHIISWRDSYHIILMNQWHTIYSNRPSHRAPWSVNISSILSNLNAPQSPGGSRALLPCLRAGVLLLWVWREVPGLLHSCGSLRRGLQWPGRVRKLENTRFVS